MTLDLDAIHAAAELITDADSLLVGTVAGMGVDSSLPDFRGTEGFSGAYPHGRRLAAGEGAQVRVVAHQFDGGIRSSDVKVTLFAAADGNMKTKKVAPESV